MRRHVTVPEPGSGGRARGPARLGCMGGIALLVLLLAAGFLFLNRGVRWTMRRARAHLERSLPRTLPPADRKRLEDDLDRFFASVEQAPGSTRRMGQFLGRVEQILDDRRVTVREVLDLCNFLEGKPEAAGPTRSGHG